MSVETEQDAHRHRAPYREESSRNLFQKLAAITAEIGQIQKDGQFKKEGTVLYGFISHGVLMANIRQKLRENGVFIIPSQLSSETQRTERAIRVYGRYSFKVVNADDPTDFFVAEWDGEAIDYGDKATQKAGTFAHKYFLMKLFLVSDKDDPDADDASLGADDGRTQRRSLSGQTREQTEAAHPSEAADYGDDSVGGLLDSLASSLPKKQGVPSWFTAKIAARIRHFKGDKVAVLRELAADHAVACGEGCEHITEEVIKALSVGE